jgi:hypothetical protein
LLKVSPDKAAVHILVNHRLVGQRLGFRLDLETRTVRMEQALGSGGAMLDMNDRPLRFSPAGKQRSDIGLGFRIVSLTPPWVVKRLLHINHDQNGIQRQRVHANFPSMEDDRQNASSGRALAAPTEIPYSWRLSMNDFDCRNEKAEAQSA